MTCKKNKNREILLRLKVPDKQTLFVLISIFLGIYLFTFAIANSYAKTNGSGKKYLTNPLNWFSEEIKNETTPTLIPTPEATPTPSPKPKTQTNNTNTNRGNQIECIGPDGKHFSTTMDECKKLADKWSKPVDYMLICTYPTECGGGERRIAKSECDKPCTRVNNGSNNVQIINPPNNQQNNSSKTAVFISYGGYTVYCPSQNVGAVQSISSTMESKKTEWAKNYNDCTDRFRKTDSCYLSCEQVHTSGWNNCISKYGYSGEEYKSCTDEVSKNYSNCITNCPSVNKACEWVYLELNSLTSQINNLCK